MLPLTRWLVVAALALGAGCGGSRSGLDAARDRAAADGSFSTAGRASEAFAMIAEDLLDAGRDCGDGDRCADLLAASGWAQAVAVRVLRCTRPGVHAARADASALLAALDDGDRAELPPVPAC